MIVKDYALTVNFDKGIKYPAMRFVKGDSQSCAFNFSIVQDITDLSLVVTFKLPDETSYIQGAEIKGPHEAYLMLPSDVLSQVGKVLCQVAIHNDGRLTNAVPFSYLVVEDFAEGGIEASDNLPILTQLITECSDIIEAEELRALAEALRVENEGAADPPSGRVGAELAREAAEAQRGLDYINAEDARNDAYDAQELVRDGLYSTAETNRNNLYAGAESDRDDLYSAAEDARNDAYDAQELVRDGLYAGAESGRDDLYIAAEAARVLAEGTADPRTGRVGAELDREDAEILRQAHITDKENPHEVTIAQIGAVAKDGSVAMDDLTVGTRMFGSSVGTNSAAIGNSTSATGACSFSQGSYTDASGSGSHAEGGTSIASGDTSHAEGSATQASGISSHSEGCLTHAVGDFSHAEGDQTYANGFASHSGGFSTIADGKYQTVIGKYNIEQGTQNAISDTDPAFIIGNGASPESRSNALHVKWNGDTDIAGNVNIPTGKMYQINGTALSAGDIGYDNTDSGLTAENAQDAIDEVTDLVSTNASEIDVLETKSATSNSRLSTLESQLTNININQEARQVLTTADRIVSLPKTAGTGGMPVVLGGMTAKNEVVNGDFSQGTTGWIIVRASNIRTEAGFFVFNPSTSGSTGGLRKDLQNWQEGHKYYLSFITNNSTQGRFILLESDYGTSDNSAVIYDNQTHPSGAYKFARIYTATRNRCRVALATYIATNEECKIGHVNAIDLTATFGSGNEPDLSTCDKLFAGWFDGLKSVVAPRIRSVGKNLFDGKVYGKMTEGGIVDGRETYKLTHNVDQFWDFKGKPNTEYTISFNYKYVPGIGITIIRLIYSDGTKSPTSQGSLTSQSWSNMVLKSDASKTLVGLSQHYNNAGTTYFDKNTIQVEEGSVATSYEPYTESLLYCEPITLRSLPNGTRDVIKDGEFVQWVSEDGATKLTTPEITENVTSGLLASYPSGTVYLEHALADAGMYTDRLTVLRADFPIDQLESIRKVDPVTGGLVPLSIATAVIAGDGLSFTHPELTAWDIVFFVYHYSYSGPFGENTFSVYDSRYVIADSSNGKYYKWQVTSANGVPAIELVEV